MEVKAGYKQTEVGIIPEDWECTSVRQLVDTGILAKPLDGNHGEIHPKSSDFVDYGIPFVMANNVQGGRVDLNNCSFIRKEQADRLRIGFSYPGDVLLTHKATIGNTAIVGDISSEYIMLTPQVTYYRVANKTRLNNRYLRHFFDSSSFQRVLLAKSGGGTRAYIGVSAQLQLPVVVPSTLAEQEAIAEALSDADALIEALEQLLAKKRQVKQGAMQELLTGKKRLPGFSGDWEIKRLGQVLKLVYGQSQKGIAKEDGNFPIIGTGGVVGKTNQYLYDRPSIIIGRKGTIDVPYYVDTPFWTIDTTFYCDVNESAAPKFLFYEFSMINWYLYNEATGVPSLNSKTVENIEINLPLLSEQTAIAEILSDMDAEIAALEAKLAKARQVKQGMMQELLTGRVRLV